MHTISIQFNMINGLWEVWEVDDDNKIKEEPIYDAHQSFMDAQNHACMLLSPTGDFRLSTLPPPGMHEHGAMTHTHNEPINFVDDGFGHEGESDA